MTCRCLLRRASTQRLARLVSAYRQASAADRVAFAKVVGPTVLFDTSLCLHSETYGGRFGAVPFRLRRTPCLDSISTMSIHSVRACAVRHSRNQLKATVRPGSVVDPLCTAKNMRTRHLELELEVIGGNRGDYNGYKIWEYITLDVDETDYSDSELNIKRLSAEQAAKFQTAVSIGRKKLRALVDSAYALNPDDQSEDAKAKRRAVSDDLLTVNKLAFGRKSRPEKAPTATPTKTWST